MLLRSLWQKAWERCRVKYSFGHFAIWTRRSVLERSALLSCDSSVLVKSRSLSRCEIKDRTLTGLCPESTESHQKTANHSKANSLILRQYLNWLPKSGRDRVIAPTEWCGVVYNLRSAIERGILSISSLCGRQQWRCAIRYQAMIAHPSPNIFPAIGPLALTHRKLPEKKAPLRTARSDSICNKWRGHYENYRVRWWKVTFVTIPSGLIRDFDSAKQFTTYLLI